MKITKIAALALAAGQRVTPPSFGNLILALSGFRQ
jgi:hypothetical protein